MGFFERFGKKEVGKIYITKCIDCGADVHLTFKPSPDKSIRCDMCEEKDRNREHFAPVESKLIAEEFAIDQDDAKAAQQIHSLLAKGKTTKQDEAALNDLVKRLVQDEKRRKKILREIVKLQKRK